MSQERSDSMYYIVPREVKKEIKIFRLLYLRDIVIIGIPIMLAMFLQGAIIPSLRLPYYESIALLGLWGSRKSRNNPGFRNWKSFVLLLYRMRDRKCYYSL